MPTPIYLETGKKRTIAGALDWPGWCRSAADEQAALQALLDYAPRYTRVLAAAHIPFHPPTHLTGSSVTERLPGDTTTDFGAPGAIPSADQNPVDAQELAHLTHILLACWQAFGSAAHDAVGAELRKGPRGGGRALESIINHTIQAEAGYLAVLGYKTSIDANASLDAQIEQAQQALQIALPAAARGDFPPTGPRGGARWPLRYYVRRSAWHILDHAWEIEDRVC